MLAGILAVYLPHGCYDDVVRILRDRPVADVRVDLEDGYGDHGDDAEDADIARCVALLAERPPPAHGVRIKSLEPPTAERSL